jgi:hypothetical protein
MMCATLLDANRIGATDSCRKTFARRASQPAGFLLGVKKPAEAGCVGDLAARVARH